MVFPEFDPVALQIGPIAIRWYALSYIVGILLAWRYCIWCAQLPPQRVQRGQLDDLMFWCTIGIILGGRLGQVLLWEPGYYLSHPLDILKVWEGGMAFHGGLLGVILAIVLYARSQKLSPFAFADIIAASTPIGLFLGRVANFVNGELVGRPTDMPWGIIFPAVRRHATPSEPTLPGGAGRYHPVRLPVLGGAAAPDPRAARHDDRPVPDGLCVARSIGEVFREPEVDLGGFNFVTWGQILSVPMFVFGLYLALRKPKTKAAA